MFFNYISLLWKATWNDQIWRLLVDLGTQLTLTPPLPSVKPNQSQIINLCQVSRLWWDDCTSNVFTFTRTTKFQTNISPSLTDSDLPEEKDWCEFVTSQQADVTIGGQGDSSFVLHYLCFDWLPCSSSGLSWTFRPRSCPLLCFACFCLCLADVLSSGPTSVSSCSFLVGL